MTVITIVGGIYHERCTWPEWDHVYGSGGRAASAIIGHVKNIKLLGYADPVANEKILKIAKMYGFNVEATLIENSISFEYIHSLSVPTIRPTYNNIKKYPPIPVKDEVVLRFGMMEGAGKVEADYCVYDPQSAFDPQSFSANGSSASHLAIVGNWGEIISLGKSTDLKTSVSNLMKAGAEVVVVKSGAAGAQVFEKDSQTRIPAYQTQYVWKVGSGDVFAAMFAAMWGVDKKSAVEAANIASRATAEYVESMSLPIPAVSDILRKERAEIIAKRKKVYLAGPFFTISQRWMIDEAHRLLEELNMETFSPVHDIGFGPAEEVAPADIAEIEKCDAMFAIVDGLDSGTIFEIGYATALKKPIYALAQTPPEEDLKMIKGSGSKIYDDLVTALYHVAWQA